MPSALPSLVIFGVSNILSDLVDCAIAGGLNVTQIVIDLPECVGERDIALASRLVRWRRHGTAPAITQLAGFVPMAGECYLLGPTTPTRAVLAKKLHEGFGLQFHTLIHPTAYVSPLATLAEGVFVGANCVIGPGSALEPHVFVNRGVTIGHDTCVGAFSRLQPGANVAGLCRIGSGVTVGIGATIIERIVVGQGAVIAAGAVVTRDVPPDVLVAGVPAVLKKNLG